MSNEQGLSDRKQMGNLREDSYTRCVIVGFVPSHVQARQKSVYRKQMDVLYVIETNLTLLRDPSTVVNLQFTITKDIVF